MVAVLLAVLSFLAGPVLASSQPAQAQPQKTQVVTFREGTTPEARRALIEKAGGSVVRDIPFIDAAEAAFGVAPEAAMRLKSEAAVETVEPNEYRKWIEAGPLPMTSVAIPSAREALGAGGAVPTLGATGLAAAPETDKAVPWGISRVHAPQAWSKTTGKGVKVGIIDTGIDATHPDLADNYAGGYNAVEPGAEPTDDHGHGTHVAGTIAGAGRGKGVYGVAPEARLYAIKVLDKKGGGTNAIVVSGIAWAVENGMSVVNMSLGGPASAAMEKAVKKAYKAGVTIVAAAGNDPEAPVSAPALYPETIAVSASASDDSLATFSTTGPEVDFIAPGHEIISTWPGGKYAKLSGTSMASPHVTGLAALAVGLGARTPADVKAMLGGAAVPVDGLDKNQQGAGMIEANRMGD